MYIQTATRITELDKKEIEMKKSDMIKIEKQRQTLELEEENARDYL
jgi:murein L,D-transpeptidase YafK